MKNPVIHVTLVMQPNSILVDYDSPHKKDKLRFQGAGINVYYRGSIGKRYKAMAHQALLVAAAHHIPLMSFRDIKAKS